MRRILLPVWVAVDVMATRIPVMDWSLNYGYCKAASEMTRRDMLEPITASPFTVSRSLRADHWHCEPITANLEAGCCGVASMPRMEAVDSTASLLPCVPGIRATELGFT